MWRFRAGSVLWCGSCISFSSVIILLRKGELAASQYLLYCCLWSVSLPRYVMGWSTVCICPCHAYLLFKYDSSVGSTSKNID